MEVVEADESVTIGVFTGSLPPGDQVCIEIAELQVTRGRPSTRRSATARSIDASTGAAVPPWADPPTLRAMSDRGLTHLDPLGRARMVDVTPKEASHRRAIARGRVHMQPETTSLIARGAITKGDVLAVARVAGIQAAKRTPDLLPLCHPLLVGAVLINFRIEDAFIEVEAQVDTVDRTGVEMEALTAVLGGVPDHLRHVQVGRPGHDDRRGRAVGEDRRAVAAPTAVRRASASSTSSTCNTGS